MSSRAVRLRVTLPDLADEAAYGAAVVASLDEHPSRVVIPAHDGTIEALRSNREAISERAALALAPEHALAIAVSKSRTLALATALGLLVPRTISVESPNDAAAAIRDLGLPVVVKPVRSWVGRIGERRRIASWLAHSLPEAEAAIVRIAAAGGEALLQHWLSGRREAVSLLVAGGVVRARFAQTSYREFPALGGASVLCESLPLSDEIVGPAERLVLAMGLEGPSMTEFRRDERGKPMLMEVNPRMAGSVGLAVRCGVNFPRLTYSWAAGEPLVEMTTYRTARRSRWLAGDLWNLRKSFESPGAPDVPGRASALTRFMADFVRRPSAIEPFDLRDPLPAFVEFRRNLFGPMRRRIGRVIGRRARAAWQTEGSL